MLRVLVILSLIVIGVIFYSNPFPQFTEEQQEIICIQEGICLE